jgi:hypothetical protein
LDGQEFVLVDVWVDGDVEMPCDEAAFVKNIGD